MSLAVVGSVDSMMPPRSDRISIFAFSVCVFVCLCFLADAPDGGLVSTLRRASQSGSFEPGDMHIGNSFQRGTRMTRVCVYMYVRRVMITALSYACAFV